MASLIQLVMFVITYFRGFFPEKFFEISVCEMKVKKLLPWATSKLIINWMEKGVALQKYLKMLLLCVCEWTKEHACKIISHTFVNVGVHDDTTSVRMQKQKPKRVFSLTFFLISLLVLLPTTQGNSFDHYILSIQWSATFCHLIGAPYCRPHMAEFKIHELWPTNINTMHPYNCKPHDLFNPRLVAGLKSSLSVDWPDLVDRSPGHGYYFWEQQWLKHGTCSGLSQFDYFKKTLELFKALDVMNKLKDIHVFPGTEIYARDLVANWAYKFTHFPRVTCLRNDNNVLPEYVFELHFNVTVEPDGELAFQSITRAAGRFYCTNYAKVRLPY